MRSSCKKNKNYSAESEAHEKNDSVIDDNDIYHIDNMSLDINK